MNVSDSVEMQAASDEQQNSPVDITPSSPAEDEQPASPSAPVNEAAKASVAVTVVNVLDNVIGGGVLSLPTSFAMASPGFGALCLMVTISATIFNLVLITETATYTRQQFDYNYGKMVHAAFGRAAPIALVALIIFPTGALMGYNLIIADVMPPLTERFLGAEPGSFFTHEATWIVIGSVIFFALSVRRYLAELFASSVLGIITIELVVLVVLFRYFDGSYAFPHGQFVKFNATEAAAAAERDTTSFYLSRSIFSAIPLWTFSMSVHNNYPAYVRNLRLSSKTEDPIEREQKAFEVVKISHVIIASTYMLMGLVGYYCFGKQKLLQRVGGDVLRAFDNADDAANVARFLLVLHLLTVYPLLCHASRRYVGNLLYGSAEVPTPKLIMHTFFLVAGTGLMAYIVPGLDVALGLNGAIAGSTVVFVVPSVLYLKLVPKSENEYMRYGAMFSICAGVVVGLISCVVIFSK